MSPTTDPKTIVDQLGQFARANLVAEGTVLEEQTRFAEVGLDSFALVELLLFCERAFGVRVPDSHLTRENLASLASLAACVAQLGRSSPLTPSSGADTPHA